MEIGIKANPNQEKQRTEEIESETGEKEEEQEEEQPKKKGRNQISREEGDEIRKKMMNTRSGTRESGEWERKNGEMGVMREIDQDKRGPSTVIIEWRMEAVVEMGTRTRRTATNVSGGRIEIQTERERASGLW